MVIEVRVTEAESPGVFGVGFDLVYPESFLNFDAASPAEGGFLGEDGADTSLVVDRVDPGRLIVSMTRLGDTTGGVDGSGVLLTLDFLTASSGSGAFEIENALLVDGAGARRFDYEFIGGNLSVQK